jgi:hypothetical protein
MHLLATLAGVPACAANKCNSGRHACPNPDACRLTDEDLWVPAPRLDSLKFWAIVGIMWAAVAGAVVLSLG